MTRNADREDFTQLIAERAHLIPFPPHVNAWPDPAEYRYHRPYPTLDDCKAALPQYHWPDREAQLELIREENEKQWKLELELVPTYLLPVAICKVCDYESYNEGSIGRNCTMNPTHGPMTRVEHQPS